MGISWLWSDERWAGHLLVRGSPEKPDTVPWGSIARDCDPCPGWLAYKARQAQDFDEQDRITSIESEDE